MSKVTKKERIKELERQVRGLTVLFSSLNTWSEYADSMLTELNHALPDPEYDAKCEAVAVEESLDRHRERLGLNKPHLKQLDQSVFKGLRAEYIFFAVDKNGSGYAYSSKPIHSEKHSCFVDSGQLCAIYIGAGFDTSDWKNSLIKRDVDLAGSSLCKEMLARGDKLVICAISPWSDDRALTDADTHYACVLGYSRVAKCFLIVSQDTPYGETNTTKHAVPIDPQTGELLTASEVGL